MEGPVKPPPPPKPGHLKQSKTFSIDKDGKPEVSPKPSARNTTHCAIPRSKTDGSLSANSPEKESLPRPRPRPVPRKRTSIESAGGKKERSSPASQDRPGLFAPDIGLDTPVPAEGTETRLPCQDIPAYTSDCVHDSLPGEPPCDNLDVVIPRLSTGISTDATLSDDADNVINRESGSNTCDTKEPESDSLDVIIPNVITCTDAQDSSDSVFTTDQGREVSSVHTRRSAVGRTPSYDRAVPDWDAEEVVDLLPPIPQYSSAPSTPSTDPAEPTRPPRSKKKQKSIDIQAGMEDRRVNCESSPGKSPVSGLLAIAARKTPPARPTVPPKPKSSSRDEMVKVDIAKAAMFGEGVRGVSRSPSYGAALENELRLGRDRYHSRSLENVKTDSLERQEEGEGWVRPAFSRQESRSHESLVPGDNLCTQPKLIRPKQPGKPQGNISMVVGELNQKLQKGGRNDDVDADVDGDGDEGVFDDEYDDVVAPAPVPLPRSHSKSQPKSQTRSHGTPSDSLDTPIPNPRDSLDMAETVSRRTSQPVRKAPPVPLSQRSSRSQSDGDSLDRSVPSPEDYSEGYLAPVDFGTPKSSTSESGSHYTYIDVPSMDKDTTDGQTDDDPKLPNKDVKQRKPGKLSSIYDAVSGKFGSLGRSKDKEKKRISSVFYYEIENGRSSKVESETQPADAVEYVNEPYVNEPTRGVTDTAPDAADDVQQEQPSSSPQPAPPPRANRRAAGGMKAPLPLPAGLDIDIRPVPAVPGAPEPEVSLEHTIPSPDMIDENEYVLPEDIDAEGVQGQTQRPQSENPSALSSPMVNLDTHPVMQKHRSVDTSAYSYPKTTFPLRQLDKSPSAKRSAESNRHDSSGSDDSDDYIYPETAKKDQGGTSEGEDGRSGTETPEGNMSPGETDTVRRRQPPISLGPDSHSSGDSGRSSSRPSSCDTPTLTYTPGLTSTPSPGVRESTWSTRQYMDMSRENLADISYVNHSSSFGPVHSPESSPSVCRSASNVSGMSAISSASSADLEVQDVDRREDGQKQIGEKEKKDEKRKRKAFNVAEEMMTSEKAFVNILRLLNEDFRRGVVDMSTKIRKAIIPQPTLDQILKHLPQLQYFNESLLNDLSNRVINWDTKPLIADVFVRKGPFLKMYTDYIRDNQSMIATLEDAQRKYPEFNLYVESFEQTPKCGMLKVRHHMLKPIQRIPQYRLLLQDYKKCLDEESPDYKDTITALKIVNEVADHANESMKYGEVLQKFLEIQNSLIGQFEVIKPGRNLIKEGMLNKMSRKELQPRKFYLFNDVLLYCTPVSGGFKLNNELSLVGMKVSRPTKEDFQNEFSIISTQRSFSVSAETGEERDEWLEALESAIQEMKTRRYSYDLRQHSMTEVDLDFKLGYKAPVWIPDARVSMCQRCRAEFTMTFRRHHCRSCGKVVCNACSDCRAPLRYLKYRPARVCVECFQQLSKDVEEMEISEGDTKLTEEEKKSSAFSKDSIKAAFRRETWGSFGRGLIKKSKPAVRQEVKANTEEADMSGYLKVWRIKSKRWKKMWFVVKQNVLYTYRASEDIAPYETTPLLGYEVRPFNTLSPDQSDANLKASWFQGIESSLLFEVMHRGMPTLLFRTESPLTRDKWMSSIRNATIPQ